MYNKYSSLKVAINKMPQAFVDSSPHYSKLEPEDREMILEIFSQVVPKYLVYRSVILAVDGAMAKVEKSAWRDRISDTAASKPWFNFRRLAHERLLVTHQAEATKGKALICDNVKVCQIELPYRFLAHLVDSVRRYKPRLRFNNAQPASLHITVPKIARRRHGRRGIIERCVN